MLLTNVSPQNFDAMVHTITSKNQHTVNMKPDPAKSGNKSGQILGHGTVIDFAYNATNQTLDATVRHHPFWVREGQIINGLRDAMVPEGQKEQATETPAAKPAASAQASSTGSTKGA